jgi:membrane-associated phospholipid phosphatase
MSCSIAERLVLAALLVCVAVPARADAPTDGTRKAHAAILVGSGVTYLAIEFPFKKYLASPECVICNPPAFDAAARDALVWRRTKAANVLSTVIGYAAAPIYATAVLIGSGSDTSFRRRYDDVVPVLEAGVSIGLLHHAVKFVLDRQRPFVHHAGSGHVYDTDDNASFFSGHTALAFAVATAGGVVAHQRGYRSETAIWVGGMAMGVATGYLRIAADKHWLSDVLIGTVIGVGSGLAIPLVFHGDAIRGTAPVTRPAGEPRFLSFGGAF